MSIQALPPVSGHAIAKMAGQPPYYQQALDSGYTYPCPVPKKRYTVMEVLTGGAGLRRDMNATAIKTINDKYLDTYPALKHLTLNQKSCRQVMGTHVYWFRCGCGRKIALTSAEAFERDKAGIGCAGPECTVPEVRHRIWHNPDTALQLQLRQLEAKKPGWSKGWERPENIHAGRWWLSGVEYGSARSWALTSSPDRWLFDGGIVARMDDELWPLIELAEAYSVPVDRAMELRIMYDDDKLIDELIGEQQ